MEWKRHIYDPGRPVSLIRALRNSGYPVPTSVIQATRDGLHKANNSYAWSELARLRDIAPEGFPPQVNDQLVSDCEVWLARQLVDPSDIEDVDELDDMRSSATTMGAQVDDTLYANAEAEISRRSRDADDPDDEDPEQESSSMSPAGEQAAIEALFARLAE